MNQMVSPGPLDDYTLDDCYRRQSGRVFLTGTQALVRLALEQARLDQREGLNSAGFITGYRGSPLGGYDQALWKAKTLLRESRVDFMPAVNEDLAATAIIGTQQVEGDPDRDVDGVFSIWYGKGPGLDRSGDAMKHGNAYGSSPNGGVLVLAGDDHGCVSSSMSHQSDVALMSWFMPVLNPASIAEYIEYGLYGFALSRFSGTWVGFKAISETVESAASIELREPPVFQQPVDFAPPDSGLHYRWPDFPGPQVEARMVAKVDAVRAFARANPIDRRIYNIADARMGIITTGKGHLDTMEALALLGLDEQRCREIGIDIYKIGMVWPLETEGAREFLRGKEEVLVIEEKRGIIESELKEFLYDYPGDKPRRMVGKYDEAGNTLVPWVGELSPSLLAPVIAKRLIHEFPQLNFDRELGSMQLAVADAEPIEGVKRLPYFCSGCPHNTSTKVPEGSRAQAGIGCHFMASWMNRETGSLIQMGGEGTNWVGKSRFTGKGHIFQNLGEGTYFHSGSMSIRQAIAAGTNITFKILFNDAVAMTGGQPVDGQLSVDGIANQVRAEGVERIAVVSDEPQKYRDKSLFPSRTTFHHRDEMDTLQRELREVPKVSVLIYDQTCAAEKRRRRKRGTYPDPAKRVFINEWVCEGCGDCSVQSNCLSIYPVETAFGRKRKIDQNSCNKDYSCVKGFCPSFVTIEGGELRQPDLSSRGAELEQRLASLPEPTLATLQKPYNLLVGGVGGTGVVTLGALLTMAAHLEGKGASVLDFMGFAQKGGSVLSYIRLGKTPAAINQVRIDTAMADAVIACDLIVGTDAKCLQVLRNGDTRVLANSFETPTGDFVLDRDAKFDTTRRLELLHHIVGEKRLTVLDANVLAERLLGHSVYANVMLLGFAWQQGLVPVSREALLRAMQLNGVAVELNTQAFNWGRLAADDLTQVMQLAGLASDEPEPLTLSQLIAHRAAFLVDYQDKQLADSYRRQLQQVMAAEQRIFGEPGELSETVARNLFKLMAYKDEYEVARLYTEGQFLAKLQSTFTGDYKIHFNLAPPLLTKKGLTKRKRGKEKQGGEKDLAIRPEKKVFGPWMLSAMKLLARGKKLRGTWLDPFGYTTDRKLERRLLANYSDVLKEITADLNKENYREAVVLAGYPDQIRGYGPVKEKAADAIQNQLPALLAGFRNAPITPVKFVEAV